MKRAMLQTQTRALLLAISVWCSIGVATAFNIVGPNNYVPSATASNGDRVDLIEVVYHAAGGARATLVSQTLAQEFPGWTINLGANLPGTLTIQDYIATFLTAPHRGGAQFLATYNPPANGNVRGLRWIQMIDTNFPLGGNTSPYIDPRPNDDNLPFYWTEQEHTANSGNDFIRFSDVPARVCRNRPDFIRWRASLFIATWDLNTPGTVTLHDGIEWGWDLHCVPEPASMLALTVGLIGLAYRRRRRVA
ncbi:MAG: PEP-CTERM sorting domain-containing protein [Fimbriimonadales bacterium]|nr:PEP-CTERM sorting domain-containing protein [Fimbriimonadales bacterium]